MNHRKETFRLVILENRSELSQGYDRRRTKRGRTVFVRATCVLEE